jgi:hypothetical protein
MQTIALRPGWHSGQLQRKRLSEVWGQFGSSYRRVTRGATAGARTAKTRCWSRMWKSRPRRYISRICRLKRCDTTRRRDGILNGMTGAQLKQMREDLGEAIDRSLSVNDFAMRTPLGERRRHEPRVGNAQAYPIVSSSHEDLC